MGDVLEYIVDGVSGLAPSGTGGIMVVGCCSVGDVGKAYLLGKDSDLEAIIGVGPLTDRLRDVFATGGQNPVVIAVPAEGTVDDITILVTHNGLGPDIAVTGTSKAAADVIFAVVKEGGRNTGTYKLSVDGDSFGPERTIPVDGAIAVGSTGVTITVPDSDMVAGDTFTFSLTEPVPSITAVMTAIEQPLELYAVESVYVVGASDAVDWAAMGARADELWNAHRPTYFRAETRLPNTGEDLDTWTAAMVAEADKYAHRFVTVCAAFGEVTDTTGKRMVRNWAGLLAGRVISIPVQRAPGRVRDGGISQGAIPEAFTSAMQQILQNAGYTTARHYAGLDSAYWADCKTMADVTSDYQYETVVRTVFKAIRMMRIQALKSMYDEAGDPTLEGGGAGINFLKTNIETALESMVVAVPSELAGYQIEIPPGQDIVNNGVAVQTTLIGLPIIRKIKLFAHYVYAGSKADPRLN